jgi:Flp pilus assembly protein TadG
MAGRDERRSAERGQALILFVLMAMAMMFVGAILFDAAQALVYRRMLQNAADTAALSAANVLQSGENPGCSGSTGGGPPRSAVESTADTSVAANLPTGSSVTITVTCPAGYNDGAVAVNVAGQSVSFFVRTLNLVMSPSSTSAWSSGVAVSAHATAIYGGNVPGKFSVVELDPYNANWKSGAQGCPSVLFSGGPTVYFEGSVQVDSACPAANGGAMGTNGNSATLTFASGAHASLTGGFSPGPLVVSPYPWTGQPVIKDPLRTLPTVPVSSLPVRSNNAYVLNNTAAVLLPGVYKGGIQLKNTSQAYLLPGIYVIDGGGFDVGAQAGVFTINPGLTSTSVATWDNDCLKDVCGALIYIRNAVQNGDSFSVGAGGTVMLRPYTDLSDYNGTNVRFYRNLLMWQDKTPVPTSTSIQPTLTLNGGGTLNMRGTLYAPSAAVLLTGGAGGSGGNSLELTVQFISWDLQIQGNSHFNFYYRNQDFAQPIQYGLVE